MTGKFISEYHQVANNLAIEIRTVNSPGQLSIPTEDNVYAITSHLPSDSPLWAAPIAQDGIAIITHPDITITDLTIQQIREIYRGYINNWQNISGQDLPIQIISRDTDHDDRREFERFIMGSWQTTPAAIITPTAEATLITVFQHTGQHRLYLAGVFE